MTVKKADMIDEINRLYALKDYVMSEWQRVMSQDLMTLTEEQKNELKTIKKFVDVYQLGAMGNNNG